MRPVPWLIAWPAALLLACTVIADEPPKDAPQPAAVSPCDLARQTKAWGCAACKEFFEDAALKDGNCPKCNGVVKNFLVCEKVAYECAADRMQGFEPGKCPKCGKDFTTRKVFAPVLYKCEECAFQGNPGASCPTHKKLVKRTCLNSGTYPHVARPKDGKPIEKPAEAAPGDGKKDQ